MTYSNKSNLTFYTNDDTEKVVEFAIFDVYFTSVLNHVLLKIKTYRTKYLLNVSPWTKFKIELKEISKETFFEYFITN